MRSLASIVYPRIFFLFLLLAPGVPGRAAPAATAPPLRVVVVDEANVEFFDASPNPARPGFERELLEGFARAHHRRLEVVGVRNWDEVVATLQQGRADVGAGHFTDTKDRRRILSFTDGVLPTQTVVVTRKPAPPITTRQELLKRRIGAVKGGAALKDMLAAGVPPSHIDDSPGQEEMLDLLRSGKVNGLARSLPVAILNQREDPALEIGLYVGERTHFAWAVRRDDTKLRDELNEHLALARSTGAWKRFVVKYFGEAAIDMLKQAER